MMQALKGMMDPTYLTTWLTTQVTTGSKQVSVIVKNVVVIPVTVAKGIKVA